MTDGAVFQGRKRNLSQHKQIRKALGLNAQNYSKVSEDSSLQLFNSCSFLNDMPLAFCIIELVFDAEGHGVDFVFRYGFTVNDLFIANIQFISFGFHNLVIHGKYHPHIQHHFLSCTT